MPDFSRSRLPFSAPCTIDGRGGGHRGAKRTHRSVIRVSESDETVRGRGWIKFGEFTVCKNEKTKKKKKKKKIGIYQERGSDVHPLPAILRAMMTTMSSNWIDWKIFEGSKRSAKVFLVSIWTKVDKQRENLEGKVGSINFLAKGRKSQRREKTRFVEIKLKVITLRARK